MVPLFIAAFNEAKIRHDDADHFFYLVVPFALAELLKEHFGLAKTDTLEKIGCLGHLHLDVNLLSGFGPDTYVDNTELVIGKLRFEVRVQKHDGKLVIGQGDDGPQKAPEQRFVALVAEDDFEQKIVFGEEYLLPVGCFDTTHGESIADSGEKGKGKIKIRDWGTGTGEDRSSVTESNNGDWGTGLS
jgi:hypothetical protein